MFMAALFLTAKVMETNQMSINQEMDKQRCYIHAKESYSAYSEAVKLEVEGTDHPTCTSVTSSNLDVCKAILTSDQLVTNLSVSTDSFRFDYCAGMAHRTQKSAMSSFIIAKGCKAEPAKGRDT